MRSVVGKRFCEVLCSRPMSVLCASVGNRNKQTVDSAMRPEYSAYECMVISCE